MLRTWLDNKASNNKKKFAESFGAIDEKKDDSPIILYGKDITYLRVKEIYGIVREYHNGQNPEDNRVVKSLSKEEIEKLEMAKKRQAEKIK